MSNSYSLKPISASMDRDEDDDELWEVRDGDNRYYFWQRSNGIDVKVNFTYAEIPGVVNISETQIEPELKEFVAEQLL